MNVIGELHNSFSKIFTQTNLYDFWFDLWDLKEDPVQAYKQKFYGSSTISTPLTNAFYSTNDFSAFDLSPMGANAITSAMGNNAPNVYYYSVATQSVNSGIWTGWYFTFDFFAHFLDPLTLLISGYSSSLIHDPYITSNYSAWETNDGVVNTVSMVDPQFNTGNSYGKLATTSYNFKTKLNFSGLPLKGQWNYVGLLPGVNHMNSVGWLKNNDNSSAYSKMQEFYINHINYINKY